MEKYIVGGLAMFEFVVTVVIGAAIMAAGVELGRSSRREAERARTRQMRDSM